MDVLAHAIETFVSTNATSYTSPLAIEAIKLVFAQLPVAYKDGANLSARQDMHNASTIAGMAFTNSSLGLVHSLAHKIGGEFGITHGLANAILMPYIIDYNRKESDRYDEIEKLIGVKNLADEIKKINKKVGIPVTLKEVTEVEITEEKFNEVLERMSKHAFDDPCTGTNPRIHPGRCSGNIQSGLLWYQRQKYNRISSRRQIAGRRLNNHSNAPAFFIYIFFCFSLFLIVLTCHHIPPF